MYFELIHHLTCCPAKTWSNHLKMDGEHVVCSDIPTYINNYQHCLMEVMRRILIMTLANLGIQDGPVVFRHDTVFALRALHTCGSQQTSACTCHITCNIWLTVFHYIGLWSQTASVHFAGLLVSPFKMKLSHSIFRMFQRCMNITFSAGETLRKHCYCTGLVGF